MAESIDDFRNRPTDTATSRADRLMFGMHDCLNIEAVLGEHAAKRLRADIAEAIERAYRNGRQDQREDMKKAIIEKLGL